MFSKIQTFPTFIDIIPKSFGGRRRVVVPPGIMPPHMRSQAKNYLVPPGQWVNYKDDESDWGEEDGGTDWGSVISSVVTAAAPIANKLIDRQTAVQVMQAQQKNPYSYPVSATNYGVRTVPASVTVPTFGPVSQPSGISGLLGGMSITTIALLGLGAYLLLKKKG